MKYLRTFSTIAIFSVLMVAIQACSFSTANMSSFKTSTDKEGKSETTTFKAGETVYARAAISNNPDKVKVKFSVVPEEAKGDLKKGESIKELETSFDIEKDGVAIYSFTATEALPGGSYKINADMINESGEKKDGKSVTVNIAGS